MRIKLLRKQPNGRFEKANQRKDFLVRAILAEEQREAFKQMLQEVIREELIRGVVI